MRVFDRTMTIYLSKRFLLNLLAVFGTCIALIFLIDSVENLRRAGNHDVGFGTVLLLSFYRLPSLTELVLPFAVLFSAMMTFLMLTKSLELVVAPVSGHVGLAVLRPGADHRAAGRHRARRPCTIRWRRSSRHGTKRCSPSHSDRFRTPFGRPGQSVWLRQDGGSTARRCCTQTLPPWTASGCGR